VSSPTTVFSYTSDPGDVLGGGASGSFTLASSMFLPRGYPDELEVRVAPPGTVGAGYFFRLHPPSGQVIQLTTYDPVTINAPSAGAWLTVTGLGSCASTISGKVTVQEYAFGTQGVLHSLRMTVELRCGAATAAFKGDIRVYADPWR